MKRMMLALVAVAGLSASALTVETALCDAVNAVDKDACVVSPVITSDAPPDKPEGDLQPDKPEGEGEQGGGTTPPDIPGQEGGKTNEAVAWKGVLELDNGTNACYVGESGATLTSTTTNENVILVKNGATLTISNYTLNKTGDCSSEDNSNFYAVNAVVASTTNALVCLDNCVLNSNANGANCLFSTGPGSTIFAHDCTLYSTNDSSRGLDATYGGTVIASKMTITTFGDHCASLATDRGNGYISVEDATLSTAGQGSALVYSTGCIEVNSATGSATGAQIAGIEGLSTIRISNSSLSGSGKKASEPVANGVIIYQSNSGDSTEGTATFEVSDSTLTSAIKGGAMFYITNSKGVITVQNTDLAFDSSTNCLVKAAGNNGDNGWGAEGSNGADVLFTAIDQTLVGNISVDGISSLDLCLTNSTYTGTFIQDTSYTGNGGSDLFISSDSTWVVTKSCTLQNLTAAPGAKIVDGSGNTVSIVNSSGTTLISGTSDPKVTVSTYTSETFAMTNITVFAIDRSDFKEMYEVVSVTPGVTSEPYDDAVSATNAADKINANKASCIAVPAGVEDSAKAAYLDKIEARVTSDCRVVVDLTSAAAIDEQALVDAVVTSATVVASLVSTNALEKATVSPTTPGLYYWIEGGTDVSAITNAGPAELSETGGSVELSKPTFDAADGRAFFKIAAGVSAPDKSNDN